MGFPRQEYWSRLSFPVPGDSPDSGIEPVSLVSPALEGRFFTTLRKKKKKKTEADLVTETQREAAGDDGGRD